MPKKSMPTRVSANYVAQQVTQTLDEIWQRMPAKDKEKWAQQSHQWNTTLYKAYLRHNFALILDDKQPVDIP